MFGRKLVLIPMDKHTFKCGEARDCSVLDTGANETDKAVKISVKVQCPAEALPHSGPPQEYN